MEHPSALRRWRGIRILGSLTESGLNQYIDIQIPLSAPESYGVKSRNECLQPIGKFNDADDYILFDDEITIIETRQPGEMIVFTPDDAHAPLIGAGPIHKAIFKVKVI